MKKLLIEERFRKAKMYLENKDMMQLEMGTEEYTKVLERIINDLAAVKSSLRTRSREGARHRKESDRIQSAISAIKYLNNKSKRMINSSMIREEKQNNDSLKRSDIKNFLKMFK
jgi:hypothetical protein